jgi:hypothetical protein
MRTFFHGWRRKAGVVSLVIALFWAQQWTESHVGGSAINLGRIQFVSLHGRMTLLLMNHGDHIIEWYVLQRDGPASTGNRWLEGRRGIFAGVELGSDVYGDGNRELDKATWYRVPHWSVVLPLTLLSAYLILWKPRKRT